MISRIDIEIRFFMKMCYCLPEMQIAETNFIVRFNPIFRYADWNIVY